MIYLTHSPLLYYSLSLQQDICKTTWGAVSCKPQAEGFQAGRRYSREHPHIAECYPSRKPAEDQSWPEQDVCFLDVKKAFNSVSHDSLLIACRRLGVPEPLLKYIHGSYERGATCLQSGGEQSTPISCKQGVKQGDPLSCLIFNAVIDWVLTSIDPKIGFQYVDHKEGPQVWNLKPKIPDL